MPLQPHGSFRNRLLLHLLIGPAQQCDQPGHWDTGRIIMLRLSHRTWECLHLLPFRRHKQPLAGKPRGLHTCKSHHDHRAAIAAAATCATSLVASQAQRNRRLELYLLRKLRRL
eukprot:scaffold137045_cov127-Phaeocystis_antarctica.AAC.1